MKVKDFDANTNGLIPNNGGGNYGVLHEIPPNEELSHPKLVKGGWGDLFQ